MHSCEELLCNTRLHTYAKIYECMHVCACVYDLELKMYFVGLVWCVSSRTMSMCMYVRKYMYVYMYIYRENIYIYI